MDNSSEIRNMCTCLTEEVITVIVIGGGCGYRAKVNSGWEHGNTAEAAVRQLRKSFPETASWKVVLDI